MYRHNAADPWGGDDSSPSQVIPNPYDDPTITPLPYAPVVILPSTPTNTITSTSTLPPVVSSNIALPDSSTAIISTTTATPTPTVPSFSVSSSTTDNTLSNPSSIWTHVPHHAQIAIILFITLAIFTIIIFSFWFCCGGRARWARHSRSDPHHHRRQRCGGGCAGHGGGERLGSREDLNPRTEGAVRNGTDEEMRAGGREPEMTRISPSVSNSSSAEEGMRVDGAGLGMRDGPPPRYEEVVPHQHQRLAGGMAVVGRGAGQRASGSGSSSEDGAMGVISDGKMPVSEMVFEDVVVERNRTGERLGLERGSAGPGGMFGMGRMERVGDTTGHTNT